MFCYICKKYSLMQIEALLAVYERKLVLQYGLGC